MEKQVLISLGILWLSRATTSLCVQWERRIASDLHSLSYSPIFWDSSLHLWFSISNAAGLHQLLTWGLQGQALMRTSCGMQLFAIQQFTWRNWETMTRQGTELLKTSNDQLQRRIKCSLCTDKLQSCTMQLPVVLYTAAWVWVTVCPQLQLIISRTPMLYSYHKTGLVIIQQRASQVLKVTTLISCRATHDRRKLDAEILTRWLQKWRAKLRETSWTPNEIELLGELCNLWTSSKKDP